jgi:hypothetical protein
MEYGILFVAFEDLTALLIKRSIFGHIISASAESQPTFWQNMLPPSPRSENKPSKKAA